MADRSRVISTGNDNKHTSRLVKAFQSLDNLKDFSQTPSGVWGSTATIKCGDVTIKSSELDFEFDIPFDDDLESNEGEIIVYNLSDNTIKQLKKGSKLSIQAGYKGDTGVIFMGRITKARTHHDEVDKITTIKIIDDIENKESINRSFGAGTKASYILRTLLGLTDFPIAVFDVASDYVYASGETVNEPIESAIKKYSEVCGVNAFLSNGSWYCFKQNGEDNAFRFVVSESTGMIGSPSPFEETGSESETVEGFEIEMLLQHRMVAGALINLSSQHYSGTYHVKSGTHRFNDGEAVTTIKVV